MTAATDRGRTTSVRHSGARQETWRQLFRFLLVGGSNTVVTAALLVVLQTWWPAPVAFTVTYVLGVAYTVALTGRVVFGAAWSTRSAAAYAGWYVLVYLVGLGIIRVAQSVGDPSPWQVAVFTVLTTAPLNFVGGRLVFARPTVTTPARTGGGPTGAADRRPPTSRRPEDRATQTPEQP